MKTCHCSITILVSLIAGVMGGVTSSQLWTERPVFAERKPEVQQVISAEEIRLVDRDGRVRATLGLFQDKPQLLFWQENERPGSSYTPRGLELCDEKGRSRFLLGVFLSGGTTLSFIDRNGKIRGMLGQEIAGDAGLLLADRDGEPRVILRARADKGPSLQLYEREEDVRVSLSLIQGKPSLEMMDGKGKTIWSAP